MSDKVRLACDTAIQQVPLDNILPMRLVGGRLRAGRKYKCIEASIRELGLIEPLVVFPQPNEPGKFMLLDGHIRWAILKEIGEASTKCLISTDDEGFTYNHKLNRLPPLQEHYMVMRAIKNGVSEERIARSLNVDVYSIRQKRDLLNGICPEAVMLLKERPIGANAFRELRKVKPMRQIEIAELIRLANNHTVGYVKCLVVATADDQLAGSNGTKDTRGLSAEEIARIENELGSLGREFKLIQESHGKNVLSLVVVVGYLRKLLDNARVVRYLSQNHSEILSEFNKLVASRDLVEQPDDT